MKMNSKKKNVKSKDVTFKVYENKSKCFKVKKQIDFGVKDYCKACQNIRNGNCNSSGSLKGIFFPHTCEKTGKELSEFIYHMNILNGMRNRGFSKSKFYAGFEDYYGIELL